MPDPDPDERYEFWAGLVGGYGADPRVEVPLEAAGDFDCCRATIRTPQETKGEGYTETKAGDAGCC